MSSTTERLDVIAPPANVGLLGLGIMGSALAVHLRAAGYGVVGHDPAADRLAAFAQQGGRPVDSARAVAEVCDVVVSLLPSALALDQVICGERGLLSAARDGIVLIESSTLSLESKHRARAAAAPRMTVLDCPISGTGAQALTRDLLVYASGDTDAVGRCAQVFAAFASGWHDVGEFGNGSKLKFVANLLVAIHNVAAAEALVLGIKAGLPPQLVYDMVGAGAGGSTMFTLRGPMMVDHTYEPATMKVDIWQKDMSIIQQFAASLRCPTPLLSACAPIYLAALAQGRGAQDTASVCAVLESLAQVDRFVAIQPGSLA